MPSTASNDLHFHGTQNLCHTEAELEYPLAYLYVYGIIKDCLNVLDVSVFCLQCISSLCFPGKVCAFLSGWLMGFPFHTLT